jgi:hypothetical protein
MTDGNTVTVLQLIQFVVFPWLAYLTYEIRQIRSCVDKKIGGEKVGR